MQTQRDSYTKGILIEKGYHPNIRYGNIWMDKSKVEHPNFPKSSRPAEVNPSLFP